MGKNVFSFAFLFVALVFFQVVIFNHIWLFHVAIPLVFIYFIASLPLGLAVNWVLTLGFLLGLTIDVFSDTPGLNALCCTLLAGLRLPILRLYLPRDEEPTVPSIRAVGLAVYMKYVITLTTLYCTLFFVVLSFDFFNFPRLILRIVSSSLLTFIIIIAISAVWFASHRRRKT